MDLCQPTFIYKPINFVGVILCNIDYVFECIFLICGISEHFVWKHVFKIRKVQNFPLYDTEKWLYIMHFLFYIPKYFSVIIYMNLTHFSLTLLIPCMYLGFRFMKNYMMSAKESVMYGDSKSTFLCFCNFKCTSYTVNRNDPRNFTPVVICMCCLLWLLNMIFTLMDWGPFEIMYMLTSAEKIRYSVFTTCFSFVSVGILSLWNLLHYFAVNSENVSNLFLIL